MAGEQERNELAIQQHRNADRRYIDEAVQPLELTSRAGVGSGTSCPLRCLLTQFDGGSLRCSRFPRTTSPPRGPGDDGAGGKAGIRTREGA